jgi:hypothetical protein
MKTLLILAVLHWWHPHWFHHKAPPAPPPVVVVKPAPAPVVKKPAVKRVVVSCRFTPAEAYQYPEALVLEQAQQKYHFTPAQLAHLKWCVEHPGVSHG